MREHTSQTRLALTLAAALGLLTGLVEGLALFFFQRAGILGFRIARVPVWTEIIFISPVVDLVLFLALGLVIVGATAVLRRAGWRVPADVSVMAVGAVLLWFDWFILLGRLRIYAVIPLSLGLASVATRWYANHVETARSRVPALLGTLAVAVVAAGLGTFGWAYAGERITLSRIPAAAAGQPNVLLIVLDTVRADHVSAYGYSRDTTPFLRQLSAGGATFDNAYATSSWTLPSHGSLLTGLAPHEHGATDALLGPGHPMLSEALLARGYRTAAFSANVDWFTRRHGFGRGFVRFGDFFQTPHDMAGRTVYGRMFDEYVASRIGVGPLQSRVLAEEINRAALRWIGGPSKSPFFVVLNYFDAHGPYEPPQPFRRRFSAVPNPGGLLRDAALRQPPRLTDAQLQGEIAAYDGGIAYMDHEIQSLVAELERRGLADNTILIVTSDHGESFGEHGLFTHRTALYRDLIHVPLIVHWPGHVPAATRVNAPVSLADMPATVLDLVNVRDAAMPGRSMAAAWTDPGGITGGPSPVQELARMPFAEFNWVPAFKGAMRSVVTDRWHYIEHDVLGAELYDIQRDPQELSNVVTSAAGAEAVPGLARQLPGRAPASTRSAR